MPDEQHTQPEETVYTEAEAELKRSRIPVVTPAGENKGMLPGIAGICLYLLLVTMLNAFFAARGGFTSAAAKYSMLGVCTLLLVGIFGLLRLFRWGWVLVISGCLVMSIGDCVAFMNTHVGFFLIRALLEMVFFLYLSRTEVRDRLK